MAQNQPVKPSKRPWIEKHGQHFAFYLVKAWIVEIETKKSKGSKKLGSSYSKSRKIQFSQLISELDSWY